MGNTQEVVVYKVSQPCYLGYLLQ